MWKLFALSASLAFCACAQNPQHDAPRIDGTSVESFHKSWQALSAGLTPTDQSKLSLAVLRIGLSDVGSVK